jgi:hypothetical protein
MMSRCHAILQASFSGPLDFLNGSRAGPLLFCRYQIFSQRVEAFVQYVWRPFLQDLLSISSVTSISIRQHHICQWMLVDDAVPCAAEILVETDFHHSIWSFEGVERSSRQLFLHNRWYSIFICRQCRLLWIHYWLCFTWLSWNSGTYSEVHV